MWKGESWFASHVLITMSKGRSEGYTPIAWLAVSSLWCYEAKWEGEREIDTHNT
jgi:hypothetical protein